MGNNQKSCRRIHSNKIGREGKDMDTIRTYLDNLFEQLPKTEEVISIKEEMLSNMEDKYESLLSEGKSKNDAIGIVIAEFGNIDELLEAFGEKNDFETDAQVPHKQTWNVAMVEQFFAVRQKATALIAVGVFIIMTGVELNILVSRFGKKSGIYDGIGLVILLVFVAIAVGIFIYAGKINNDIIFNSDEMQLSIESKIFVKNYEEHQKSKAIIPIIIGVMLCILAPLFIIIPGFDEQFLDKYVDLLSALLIFIVSISVFLFIYFNGYINGVNILLGKNEYSESGKKAEKIIGAIAGVYWPLVTIIFLAYSFTTGDWGRAWIIWPVAGILFGAIAAFTSIIHGVNDN